MIDAEFSNLCVFRLGYAEFRFCLMQIEAGEIYDGPWSDLLIKIKLYNQNRLYFRLSPTETITSWAFLTFDSHIVNHYVDYAFLSLLPSWNMSLTSASLKFISDWRSQNLRVELRLGCLSFEYDTDWVAPCTQTDKFVSQNSMLALKLQGRIMLKTEIKTFKCLGIAFTKTGVDVWVYYRHVKENMKIAMQEMTTYCERHQIYYKNRILLHETTNRSQVEYRVL